MKLIKLEKKVAVAMVTINYNDCYPQMNFRNDIK